MHYVSYDTFLGKVVTQTKMCKDSDNPVSTGKPKKIFFEYLFKKHQRILSNDKQTSLGKSFWLRRMRDAVNQNLKVALVNMNTQEVQWYDPKEHFNAWIESNKAWGQEEKYQALRYLISN